MKKTIVSSALLTVLCLTAGAQTSGPKFIRTATTPAFETDFTNAAEKTVNAVVCIKSFATRAQQGYGQGGYDPFGMFDFFFGNPGGGQRQQPRQHQKQKKIGTGADRSRFGRNHD